MRTVWIRILWLDDDYLYIFSLSVLFQDGSVSTIFTRYSFLPFEINIPDIIVLTNKLWQLPPSSIDLWDHFLINNERPVHRGRKLNVRLGMVHHPLFVAARNRPVDDFSWRPADVFIIESSYNSLPSLILSRRETKCEWPAVNSSYDRQWSNGHVVNGPWSMARAVGTCHTVETSTGSFVLDRSCSRAKASVCRREFHWAMSWNWWWSTVVQSPGNTMNRRSIVFLCESHRYDRSYLHRSMCETNTLDTSRASLIHHDAHSDVGPDRQDANDARRRFDMNSRWSLPCACHRCAWRGSTDWRIPNDSRNTSYRSFRTASCCFSFVDYQCVDWDGWSTEYCSPRSHPHRWDTRERDVQILIEVRWRLPDSDSLHSRREDSFDQASVHSIWREIVWRIDLEHPSWKRSEREGRRRTSFAVESFV